MIALMKSSSRILAASATALILVTTVATNIVLPMQAHAAAASTPTTSPTQAAKVSFTFDDGLQSVSTLAVPTLAKYGLTGTTYVVSGCVGMVTVPNTCRADTTKPYLTWDQVKSTAAAGWEIGSHTVDHQLLASTDPADQPVMLTDAQVVAELTDSKAAILQNTGINPISFATPYGDYTPSGNPTLSAIAKLYTSHRGFADTGYNITPTSGGVLPAGDTALNNFLIRDQIVRTSSDSTTNTTVAQAEAFVDKAITDKAWVVLTFHDITAGAATAATDSYDYSNADLDAIAAYVKAKVDVGLIKDINISQGIQQPAANQVALLDETFSNGLDGWTTDSAANIKPDAGNNGSISSSPASESTNSVSITGTTVTTHLFSPKVAVDPVQTYVLSSFVNITSLVGEIGFYVNEYDAAGTEIAQVAGTTGGGYKLSVDAGINPHVAEVNFAYKPTPGAATASLQIIAVSNATQTYQAYVDNIRIYSVTGTTAKVGDLNGDGVVNALDLSTLLSNWYKTGLTSAQGDLNGDGTVNAFDLSTLLTNWSK